ncbi:S-layer homology domain-containing protein [Oscillospiraceae bacterium 50-16]
MKKRVISISVILCVMFCLLAGPAAAASEPSSTITISVSELKPGYYLCAVWDGSELLRLFDYSVDADGKLETTVEVGKVYQPDKQLTVGISSQNVDGEVIPPITCTVNHTPSVPDRPASSGSSSSSGDSKSDPIYGIQLPSHITGGTVQVSPTRASKDQRINLTVTPGRGFEIAELSVAGSQGNTLELTGKSDTQYTFTMPASEVTVNVSFRPISAPTSPVRASFSDVPSSAYYYDAVQWAVERGITSGIGNDTFSPDAPCTRAQIMTFLWRASGSPEADADTVFTDVSANAYYAEAVQWAVSNGITSGTGANVFSPDAPCTRAQAMMFLYRAEKSPAVSGEVPFGDVSPDAYYADAVNWAVEKKITGGTSETTFSPEKTCTRGQIVTFLYAALGA